LSAASRELTSFSRTAAPERHHRRPPRRGPSRRRRRARASPKRVSGSLVSTPAVRAAERRSKRGMAVRPSPASIEKASVHSAAAGLPARDRPVRPLRPEGRWSPVADVRLRIRGAFRRGCRPPAPRLAKRAAGGATETIPISECRRRHEGTGARISVCLRRQRVPARFSARGIHPRGQDPG